MEYYRAAPRSRREIRRAAYGIRKSLGLENSLYIDVIRLLENFIPVYVDTSFKFLIATMSELGDAHGLTIPAENKILIREDVYNGACQGSGRDRFTIAHEFGHYFLHHDFGLARVRDHEEVKTYCKPEWQADAFAGEFLMPAHLVHNMTAEEIAARCGVSLKAALCQKRKT